MAGSQMIHAVQGLWPIRLSRRVAAATAVVVLDPAAGKARRFWCEASAEIDHARKAKPSPTLTLDPPQPK